jgi:hypothetical protein
MASVNIVKISEVKDDPHGENPAIIKSLQETDTTKKVRLLHGGKDIEDLNQQQQYTDEHGEVWVLPLSKEFPDFINNKYSTPEYLSTKENFLDKIIAAAKSDVKQDVAPPFPYQKFVRDYLRIGTPYRGLLLEHGLGSGKTRSAIMVSKTFREAGLKTLVLTPAFLRLNFIDELEKWEDDGVDYSAWYKFAHYNAPGYRPGSKSGGRDVGGKGGVFEQLARYGIGFPKSDTTYGNTFPYLNDTYRDLKPPEHMLIIIEEAHNLSRAFTKIGSSTKGGRGKSGGIKHLLYHLLMMAKDCKFLMLTGTPIVSSPYEMAPMYNIIRGSIGNGKTIFPMSEDAFNSSFINSSTQKIINENLMMQRMIGINSFFHGIKDDDGRVIFPAREDITVNLTPSSYQMWMHDTAFDNELGTKNVKDPDVRKLMQDEDVDVQKLEVSGTYYTRSRASCNFVFPESIIRPRKGTKEWEKLEAYVFEFETLDGQTPETVEQLEEIRDKLLEDIVIDEDTFPTKAELDQGFETEVIYQIREVLSQVFMGFSDLMKENDGLPGVDGRPSYDVLSDNDKLMITKTIGKYDERIKLALRDLALMPEAETPFKLANLKKYSAKMHTIYKFITSDTKHGAPQVVDKVKARPANVVILKHEPDQEAEVDGLSIVNEEEEETLDSSAKHLTDPDDPLIKPEFNIYQNEADLESANKMVVGGPSLVYSYFSSAEGAQIFAMVLEAHGFSNFTSTSDKPETMIRAKRYAFFRGGMNRNLKRNILKVFNSKENVNGQLIRVIFVTQAAAEGITLYHLRQIHIMEPNWDNVMIEQVIGRGFRINAHRYITNPDDRFISVYRYACVRPQMTDALDKFSESIGEGSYYSNFSEIGPGAIMADHLIQKVADRKDVYRFQIKDIRIKSAVDCVINNKYNQPKMGCFTYHDKSGVAFTGDLVADIGTQKSVRTHTVSKIVQSLTMNGKKFLFYPDDNTKITLTKGDKSVTLKAKKLFGPVAVVPKAGEAIPEHLIHQGYVVIHKGKEQYISRDRATEA